MQDNGKITAAQLRLLVVIFTIGSSIIVATSGLAQEAGRDAWIAVIVGVVISLSFVKVYMAIYRLYPGLTLVEVNALVFGKWIGTLISAVYFIYFLLLSSLLVREIGDFLTTYFLVNTPIQAIHIIYLLIVVWGIRIGLEALTRAAEIFFPWLILLFFMLIVCLLPNMQLERILPVFDGGIKPIIRAVIPFLGLPFLELVTFLMVLPTIIQREQTAKAMYQGMVTGGMMLFLLVITTLLVNGPLLASGATYPSYTLTRQINIGHFLERIEVFIAILWFVSIFFKTSIGYYALTVSLAQMLGLKESRHLTIALAPLVIACSILLTPNLPHFREFIGKAWTPFSATVGLLIPLLLLGLSKLRFHQEEKQPSKSG